MLARLSALLAMLLTVAAVWWWWPVRPRVAWEVPAYLQQMDFAPNGQAVVLSHGGGLAYYNVANGTNTPIAYTNFGPVSAIHVADDGQSVVFHDGDLKLWHPTQGVTVLHGGGEPCALVGRKVVSMVEIADALTVHVHDFTGQRLQSQHYIGVRRFQTAAVGDGRVLAVLFFSDRQELQVVDLASGQLLSAIRPFVPGLTQDFDAKLAAMLSPDGRFLATLMAEGTTVYALPSLTTVCTIPRAQNEYDVPCEFNGDGSLLATYRWTGPSTLLSVRVWRIRPQQAEHLFDLGEKPTFAPDRRHFIARPREPFVEANVPRVSTWLLFDADSPLRVPLSNYMQHDCIFAPDGLTLAAPADQDPGRLGRWLGQPSRHGVWLFDVPGGRFLPWFREGTKFAYFPDGRSLAIQNGERLEVWDVDARRPWWVEWGLPVAFCGLIISAIAVVRRSSRT